MERSKPRKNRLAEETEFRIRQENFIAAEEQRRAQEEQRRAQEEQRRREDRTRAENERIEAKEQAARRNRIETERDLALLNFFLGSIGNESANAEPGHECTQGIS